MHDDLNWHLSVSFNDKDNCFTLKVNDVDVMNFPSKIYPTPAGPQLIMNNSKIRLNNQVMEMRRKCWSVAQFAKQRRKKLNNVDTEDVWLEFLRCSSSETIS